MSIVDHPKCSAAVCVEPISVIDRLAPFGRVIWLSMEEIVEMEKQGCSPAKLGIVEILMKEEVDEALSDRLILQKVVDSPTITFLPRERRTAQWKRELNGRRR